VIVLAVVGTRPQFVKAALVSRALRRSHREILVHTGQHYDDEMSALFFRELELPEPDEHLMVGSGTHAEQTARMLVGVEGAIGRAKPDVVLVYGDTNSALAGALAAVKMGVPVVHVEAGCRSYDRTMPEEINRVMIDHTSRLLLCPTSRAVRNLAREGITEGVHWVGDVMLDLLRNHLPRAEQRSQILQTLGLAPASYLVATIHRASNTDCTERLCAILEALEQVERPVVVPVHPRTRRAMSALGRTWNPRVRFIDPVGYLDMLVLLRHAQMVLTDSGGIQKETFFLGIPCLTLRDTTEWEETVEAGWNRLVGTDRAAIVEAVRSWTPTGTPSDGVFGGGRAVERIVEVLAHAS